MLKINAKDVHEKLGELLESDKALEFAEIHIVTSDSFFCVSDIVLDRGNFTLKLTPPAYLDDLDYYEE